MYMYMFNFMYNNIICILYCYSNYRQGKSLKSYPYPVPIFPGLVKKFLPGDWCFCLGLLAALNDVTGPDKVP